MTLRLTLIFFALLFIGSIADVPVMFLAERGEIPLSFVFIAGFLADVVPDFFWYWLGKKIGLERFARIPLFQQKPERIQKVDRALHRYGAYILFSSKFAYAFGIPTQIVAGAHRYPLKKFFIANSLGAAGWLVLLYWLAKIFSSIDVIEEHLENAKLAFFVFLVAGIGLYFLIGIPLKRLFNR